jgi:hypothetical protein
LDRLLASLFIGVAMVASASAQQQTPNILVKTGLGVYPDGMVEHDGQVGDDGDETLDLFTKTTGGGTVAHIKRVAKLIVVQPP